MIFSKFCFANILPIVFLSSPMHAETGFEGLQNGFFGFSFGGYRRGVYSLVVININFNSHEIKLVSCGTSGFNSGVMSLFFRII